MTYLLGAHRGAISPMPVCAPGHGSLESLAHFGPFMDELATYLSPESLLALRACSTQLRASVRPFHLERQSLDEFRRLAGRFVPADELQQLSVHPKCMWLLEQHAPITARLLSFLLPRRELPAVGEVRRSTLHRGEPSVRFLWWPGDFRWLPEGYAGLAPEGKGRSWFYGAHKKMPFDLPPHHTLMKWEPGPRSAPTPATPRHFIVTDGRGRLHLLEPAGSTLVELPGQPDGSVTGRPARSSNGRFLAYLERPQGAERGTLVTYDLDNITRHARELPCNIDRAPVVTDTGEVVICSGGSVIELAKDGLKVLWNAPSGKVPQCVSADGRFAFYRFDGDLWITDLRTSSDLRLRGTGHGAETFALSPLGARLALTDEARRVLVYDLWGADAHGAPLIARAVLDSAQFRPQVVFDDSGRVDVLSVVHSKESRGYHIRTDTLSIDEGPDRSSCCTLL